MVIIDFIRGLWNRMFGRKCTEKRCPTRIVVVGMEKSRKYGNCPGSRVDSNAMCGLLSRFGTVKLLQETEATRESVTEALKDALQGEFCIFYYSGHGGQMRDSKGENGISEFLCLDDGPLNDYKIWEMLQEAKGRVFMIFDCCHSATMFRAAEDGTNDAVELKEFKNVGFRFDMLRDAWMRAENLTNLLVWSGCPANDYSYGDASGGVLTNGIRRNYRSGISYDSLWKKAENFAKSQNPVRTRIGPEFTGEVFR